MPETFSQPIFSNPGADGMEQMRARLAEHGYLFLRDIAPKEKVLELRAEILEQCRAGGWLDEQAPLMDAVWSGAGPYVEGEPEFMAVYAKVLALTSFERLPEDPVYVDLLTGLLEAPVYVHKNRKGRISFPQNIAETIPAHQDFHYIRGAAETYTVWTPLGDIPHSLGGLAVLSGSHRIGLLSHTRLVERRFEAAAITEDQWATQEGLEWVTADFQLGDCLIFHSHTVHKALPNRTNHLRLSTDTRYQREGDPIDPLAKKAHYEDFLKLGDRKEDAKDFQKRLKDQIRDEKHQP